MSKTSELKKVFDTEKIKKNSVDVFGLLLGLVGGQLVNSMVKGKLPMPMITDPLVTLAPGIAGAILLDDPFQKSIAKGVAAVGAAEGLQKVVSSIPALSFAKPYVPVVSKGVAGIGRVGRIGQVEERPNVLLGLSDGMRMPNDALMAAIV